MTDSITSVHQNTDGSFIFGFTFDDDNGATCATNVTLPARMITVEDENQIQTQIVDPTPYTLEEAREAVIPVAAAQKAAWLNQQQEAGIVGPVSL